ncbi:MAG: SpoIID/LytB domain-containing protein [Actinobacteria bacterium]|nr:SpoIID/LytB domain-containing protein [Actinomycetota bacterium]
MHQGRLRRVARRTRRALSVVAVLVLITAGAIQASAAAAPASALGVGQNLSAGQNLVSSNGRFVLVMQGDGNLVEYDAGSGSALWNTGTNGSNGRTLVMQGDGNLVIYRPDGSPVWASGTAGKPASTLTLQDDGNLVLYTSAGTPVWNVGLVLQDTLLRGMVLRGGTSLIANNQQYLAAMQTDGNFVVYGPTGVSFATNTAGNPGAWLYDQADGNLVVYSATNRPLWASSTFGAGGRLAMQGDGNLVLYDATGTPEWAPRSQTPNGYMFGDNASWAVSGRGNGHGHGLSQWGAYGAAAAGLNWSQIVAFYYPGTTQTSGLGATPIRVKLDMAGTGGVLAVAAATGLAVVDTADNASWPAPAGYSQYRVIWDASVGHERLQGLANGAWTNLDLPGRGVFSGLAEFSNPNAQVVHVYFADGSAKDFRGVVEAVASAGSVYPVNILPLDWYVQGVIPREMPSSWAPDAVAAQAVAARTYALYEVQHSGAQPYDICSTTNCQVYGGLAAYDGGGNQIAGLGEAAASNAAVAATAGVALYYGGSAAFTQFSAADGGYTSYGGQPYLPAQADPYDGYQNNASHAYSATISAAQIKAAWPQLAHLEWVMVTSRDGNGDFGGRVNTVVIYGVDGSGANVRLTVTGSQFASAMGLRNNWFGFV